MIGSNPGFFQLFNIWSKLQIYSIIIIANTNIIIERPAPAKKTLFIPPKAKNAPIKIGPKADPNGTKVQFADVIAARFSIGTDPMRSMWILGSLIPWAIPNIRIGTRSSQTSGTRGIDTRANA